MRVLLYFTWMTALSYGLWVHDWKTIAVALALAVAQPMLSEDLERHKRERLLDNLWDDGDLSDSA